MSEIKFTLIFLALFFSTNIWTQCADTANIFTFTFGQTTYDIVKEKKTWEAAAACAAELGGKLAEINSDEEQGIIFRKLMNDAGINIENTIAPDGGNASYVWIGGNDLDSEGDWIWDGDNDKDGAPFWKGDASGSAVDNAYTNWGTEPDDFGGGQDALGLAVTDWPLGVAGQWNDVDHENELYYVIERQQNTTSVKSQNDKNGFAIFPNPANHFTFLKSSNPQATQIAIYNLAGQYFGSKKLSGSQEQLINLDHLNAGFYLMAIEDERGVIEYLRLVKR